MQKILQEEKTIMKTIGFIGLGNMGKGMSINLERKN